MAACRPTTLEQLKVSFKQAWSSITPADCQTAESTYPVLVCFILQFDRLI